MTEYEYDDDIIKFRVESTFFDKIRFNEEIKGMSIDTLNLILRAFKDGMSTYMLKMYAYFEEKYKTPESE